MFCHVSVVALRCDTPRKDSTTCQSLQQVAVNVSKVPGPPQRTAGLPVFLKHRWQVLFCRVLNRSVVADKEQVDG